MTTEIIAGALGEDRLCSTAGGGTALTTTAAFTRLPLVTNHITVTPRNYSTAVVVQMHLNPWLVILKTTDALATAPTDYSNAGQDLNAAAGGVVLSSLDTLANGDFLLVGAHLPFRGVRCVNATTHSGDASVLTVNYSQGTSITAWATSDSGTKSKATASGHGLSDGDTVIIKGTNNYDGTWVVEQVVATTSFVIVKAFVADDAKGLAICYKDISATDGTAAAGKTMAQTGNVTWTVPTDWKQMRLKDMYSSVAAFPNSAIDLYWTRWSVSAALDATVTLSQMLAMNRTTTYTEWLSGQTLEERIRHGEPGGIGNIEALTDAGTASLIVNAFTVRDGGFVS